MEKVMKVSDADKNILKALQKNPSYAQAEQASNVGMSRSSYWRHVKELEEGGVILKRRVELDARKIGLKLRASCVISINSHRTDARTEFETHIKAQENVLECFATSGGNDYLLTIIAPDIEVYYEMMSTRILNHPTIESAHTSFIMDTIKDTHVLPL